MKKLLLSLLVVGILISCKSENPLYDNSDKSWKCLVSLSDESGNKVSLISQPKGEVISHDLYLEKNGKNLPGKVTKIAVFGQDIFLLIPEAYKIIVLDRFDYSEKAVIDFSEKSLEPTDICYVNATNAYVSHANSNSVSLLDIKYYKTAKTIYTGSNPVSITYANNYIFTANVNSHTVSMLEAREHYKVMDFPIEHYPVYTASIPYNNNIVVVTAGKGKIDTTQEKTNAMVYIINPQSKSVIYSAPIEYSAVKANDVIPNGLAVSDKNMMFISSQAALFYLNATSPSSPMIVKKEAYKSVSFNPFKSELILIKNINNTPSAHTGSNTNGKTLSDLFLPNNYVTLCPL